jgi:hypothetical protein
MPVKNILSPPMLNGVNYTSSYEDRIDKYWIIEEIVEIGFGI